MQGQSVKGLMMTILQFVRKQSEKESILAALRSEIRTCGRRFREADDTSSSLFHPDKGFVIGYDTEKVETILDAFQARLQAEQFHDEEAALYHLAKMVGDRYQESDVQGFAERIEQYMLARSKDITVSD